MNAFERYLEEQRKERGRKTKKDTAVELIKKMTETKIYFKDELFCATSTDRSFLEQIVNNYYKNQKVNPDRWTIKHFGVEVIGRGKWDCKEGFSLWFK